MYKVIIVSPAVIESRSPFIISVNGVINNDPMKIKFIGDYARAISENLMALRVGDQAMLSGIVRGGTVLVEQFEMVVEVRADILGRKTNIYT